MPDVHSTFQIHDTDIDRFRDIISVSVLQLLKIVIVDEGEKFRDRINDILYNNLAASITESTFLVESSALIDY